MLNNKRNESLPFTKSPKMAQKIDYPEKEYQSVIDRARLTLFNLTDIWKSKIDPNKVNKSCESIAVNRKALDVLTVWTKHRRSPSAEIGATPKKSLYIENGDGERWRLDKKACIKVAHSKTKPKSRNLFDKGKPKSMARGTAIQTRRRSYDAGLNQLSFESQCDFRFANNRQSRLSWESLIDENDNAFFKSQVNPNKSENCSKNQDSIVKARLKFKKTKTYDDLYVNVANDHKSIKVLKRQTSVLPIITINDCDHVHSNFDAHKQPDKKMTEPTDKSIKPRKKLSFREPVVLNEKVKELREKHSIKNEINPKKEEANSNESLDQVYAIECLMNNY